MLIVSAAAEGAQL